MSSVGTLHAPVFERRIRVLSRHLGELIPNNVTVLDLGCGNGRLAELVARHRQDIRFLGADPLIRESVAIPAACADGTKLPFGDGAVDGVMLIDVLHHTTEPLDVLREAARVASRFVVIKDHLANGPVSRATLRLMDWVGNARYGVNLPYNYLSTPEWKKAFEDAGLEPSEERDRLGLYPRPLTWAFDASLHFVSRFEKRGGGHA